MTKLRYFGWEGYAEGLFAEKFRVNTEFGIEGTNHVSDDLASRMVLAKPAAWDIININTPFVRDVFYPKGLIQPLPHDLATSVRGITGTFGRFRAAAEGRDGQIIGIPQRCGPFNLVINQNRISCSSARDQGFASALDPAFEKRFGILAYDDFNVMHIAIAAGLNPFEPFDEEALGVFSDAARRIFASASVVTTDHDALNRGLVDGNIDFYVSGGTYTASSARLAGRHEVKAVTPDHGPINGKGGVAFVEINAILSHGNIADNAGQRFLQFIDSDNGALAAALAGNACNPVAQMHRSSLFERFTADQLSALQWDDFEQDLGRCADYTVIPDYEKLLKTLRAAQQPEGFADKGALKLR